MHYIRNTNSYIARKAASGAFSAARSLASGASLVASGASKGAKQLKAQMPSATHLKKSMPAAPKLSQLYSYPATRREKSSNSTSTCNSPGASPSHRVESDDAGPAAAAIYEQQQRDM
jgi:hypothetical protein